MKKSLKKLLIILTVIILLFGSFVYYFFFDIQNIKGQEKIAEAVSPDGTYTVTAYLNNGGATVDYAVLGTVTTNKTGKEKNIYWNHHCYDAKISWHDERTVEINGITLDVKKDIYDWRREKQPATF